MSVEQLLQGNPISLRDFGLMFARLVANLAVDPHGYFEKKYVARIEQATSDNEIQGVLTLLVQWMASSSVSDAERARLDSQLGEQGLPTIDNLRAQLLP